jgi:hypothetical protein
MGVRSPARARLRSVALLLALGLSPALAACHAAVGPAAVDLRFRASQRAAGDASVYIDEEYVGPLGYVAARGVRLPVGEHRITITKDGYFPWDRLVESDRQPIRLDVELVPVPD